MNIAFANTVLELDGICRQLGAITALETVSLCVAQSEIVCLVGPSGCGKSSLSRALSGIDAPDNGRVVHNGREVCGQSRYVEPEDHTIGFMFQDYALFPHLGVTDNILFALKRLDHPTARKRCAEIIARLDLDHLADRFPTCCPAENNKEWRSRERSHPARGFC